jgi:hypothetical protein
MFTPPPSRRRALFSEIDQRWRHGPRIRAEIPRRVSPGTGLGLAARGRGGELFFQDAWGKTCDRFLDCALMIGGSLLHLIMSFKDRPSRASVRALEISAE